MYDSAQKRTFLNHATTRNFKEKWPLHNEDGQESQGVGNYPGKGVFLRLFFGRFFSSPHSLIFLIAHCQYDLCG